MPPCICPAHTFSGKFDAQCHRPLFQLLNTHQSFQDYVPRTFCSPRPARPPYRTGYTAPGAIATACRCALPALIFQASQFSSPRPSTSYNFSSPTYQRCVSSASGDTPHRGSTPSRLPRPCVRPPPTLSPTSRQRRSTTSPLPPRAEHDTATPVSELCLLDPNALVEDLDTELPHRTVFGVLPRFEGDPTRPREDISATGYTPFKPP